MAQTRKQRAERIRVEGLLPEIIERLEYGESLNRICSDLGISINCPRTLIHELRPGLIQAPRKRLIDPEVKRKAVAEYMRGTETYKAVAKRYGVEAKTLWRWVYGAEGVFV